VATSGGLEPSRYQQDIYDAVHEHKAIIVDAVAGSGKTTTLAGITERVEWPRILFLAFNTSIIKEVRSRVPDGVDVKTINALGHSTIMKEFRRKGYSPQVKDEKVKYGNLVKRYIREKTEITERTEQSDFLSRVLPLIGMAQLTLADPASESELHHMALTYDLSMDEWEQTWPAVATILQWGEEEAPILLSFNDQVWLPYRKRWRPYAYDLVLVDECQDLSRARLELALNARKREGHVVFVGDRRQAIYAWAGADSRSMDNIKQRVSAIELPLTTCYRCPRSHVELAATVRPGIEAAPGARQGRLVRGDEDEAIETVAMGDLVICRTTEPLVALCFKLIRAGRPARVRGREIGERLLVVVRAVERQPGFTYREFERYLDQYLRAYIAQVEEDVEDDAAMLVTSMQDRVETVRTVYRRTRPSSGQQLRHEINKVFADTGDVIWLSTVHRAKGLEADRVFILRPELMPHPNAKTSSQKEQEGNLEYVAYTRAKDMLFFIEDRETPSTAPWMRLAKRWSGNA